jgi:hypothetical protein
MAFLGMCSTKRGCKRLKKKRADKRSKRHERKLAKIAIKSDRVGVDGILATKGIDSRGSRNSNMWGGIGNIVDSVGSTVTSLKSPNKSTNRNSVGSTIAPSKDQLVNLGEKSKNKLVMAGVGALGLIALLFLKFKK